MKKIFAILLLSLFINIEYMPASEYSEHECLELIDFDPFQYENIAQASNLKVIDREFEETVVFSKDCQDPEKSLEQMIQHQNQDYISSLGITH